MRVEATCAGLLRIGGPIGNEVPVRRGGGAGGAIAGGYHRYHYCTTAHGVAGSCCSADRVRRAPGRCSTGERPGTILILQYCSAARYD